MRNSRGVISRRGQTMLEYSVLIVVVASMLIAMAIYAKRSGMAQLRKGADSLGEGHYDPRHTTSNITTTTNSASITRSKLMKDQPLASGRIGDIMTSTTEIQSEQSTRSGIENMDSMERGLWQ